MPKTINKQTAVKMMIGVSPPGSKAQSMGQHAGALQTISGDLGCEQIVTVSNCSYQDVVQWNTLLMEFFFLGILQCNIA